MRTIASPNPAWQNIQVQASALAENKNGDPSSDNAFMSVGASGWRIGVVLAPVLALIVGLLLWISSGTLTFQDDAAQYLSTANHILDGSGLRTSVLYYDSQLAQQAPAVQTVWPGGFPVLVAALSALSGLPTDRALLMVAILAHLGTAVILLLILRLIGLGRSLAIATAAFWIIFVPSWVSVSRGLSDPLFQLFSMSAMVAIACYFGAGHKQDSSAGGRDSMIWFLLASLTVIAAMTVRYQAVALIGPLGAAMTIARYQNQAMWSRLASGLMVVIPPTLLVVLMFLRNYWVTESLTGGAVSGRGQTLTEVASRITWLPEALQMTALIGLILSSLLCAVLAAILWIRGGRMSSESTLVCAPATRAVLVYCLSAYAANVGLLLYLCLTSTAYVIVMRYMVVCLLLLIPPAMWLVSCLLRHRLAPDAGGRVSFISKYGVPVVIGFAGCLQLASLQGAFFTRLEQAPPTLLHQTLRAHSIGDQTALDWLREKQKATPILMSSHAHALSLLTSATVVGVPVPIYTPRLWLEDEIKGLAMRHKVTYLLAFRGLDTWVYRDFVNKMLDTNRCPDWLEPVVANQDLVIARVTRKIKPKSCDSSIPPPGPAI